MILYPFLSSFLFAISIPLIKLLLVNIPELELSSILYLSSFVFLFFLKLLNKNSESKLNKKDIPYLLLSIIFGGFLGPVFMIFSLKYLNASSVSLFANFEMIFTVIIAILFLGESKDIKFFTGFFLVLLGVVFLNFNFDSLNINLNRGIFFILASTLSWACDNNFTAKISTKDPISITMFKGLGGGALSLLMAFFTDNIKPISIYYFLGAVVTGIFSYALSLVFLIYSIREMGVSRTFAIFNSYPLLAFVVSMIVFSQPLTNQLAFSFILVTIGMMFVIYSKHTHWHTHIIEHEHLHSHDDTHHIHEHSSDIGQNPHSCRHAHNISHSHPHYSDIHHNHH